MARSRKYIRYRNEKEYIRVEYEIARAMFAIDLLVAVTTPTQVSHEEVIERWIKRGITPKDALDVTTGLLGALKRDLQHSTKHEAIHPETDPHSMPPASALRPPKPVHIGFVRNVIDAIKERDKVYVASKMATIPARPKRTGKGI